MIKERLSLFLILLIVISISIGCQKKKTKSILVVDVETAIHSPNDIKCSDFIESIQYVPLETKENNLIHKLRKIDLVDNYLLIQDLNNCFVFDCKSGEYIRRISKRGRGPGEYNHPMGITDPVERTVFLNTAGADILEYSILNKLVRTITIPAYDSSFENPSFPSSFAIYQNWMICYFANINGKEKKLLMGVNKDTGIPDFIVPNSNLTEHATMSFSSNEASFYSYKNKLFFKEIYNDTIYQLVDKKLAPHTVLQTGELLFSYKMKFEGGNSLKDYLLIQNVSESERFINFNCILDRKQYFMVYSKSENKSSLTELDKGIINDIDGFLNFKPKYKSCGLYLYGVAYAYEILQWFNENPNKAAKLPAHLQKLKDIKESDNPVVMIAKLIE